MKSKVLVGLLMVILLAEETEAYLVSFWPKKVRKFQPYCGMREGSE